MACESCKRRREEMKRFIAKRLGITWKDANPPANIQDSKPEQEAVQAAETIGQAEDPDVQHGQQDVESDQGTDTGEGSVQVPSLSENRTRTKRAR